MACQCPPGYVSVGNNCVKTTNSPATSNGTLYTAQFAGPYPYWGSSGANFYSDITSLSKPLGGNATNILDANSAVVPVANNIQSPLWGQFMNIGGPFYGRQNVCAIWTNLPTVPSTDYPGLDDYPPIKEWIGFSTCITVPTTGTYCIGMSADNCLRFKIDGQLIVQLGTATTGAYNFNFNYWHVFPITLAAGQHIIEMEGLNQHLIGFFAAEIYQASIVQLAGLTSQSQLSAVTIFSTANKFNQQFTNGQASGYNCDNNCAVNLCGPTPQCTCYDIIPNEGCCYKLTNCATGQVIITNTNLSASVGSTVNLSGQTGCWQVESSDLCTGAISVSITATYSSCQECLPCWKLTNCLDSNVTFNTNVNLSAYVGQVVQIANYPRECWTVSASSNCANPTVVQIVTSYSNCDACTRRCYLLTDCSGEESSIITSTNLAQYVGQVIQISNCDVCWLVTLSTTCTGSVPVEVSANFTTCELCDPPPVIPSPELLHQRKVRPGYNPPGCDPAYTDKVECAFSDEIYNIVKKRRYGISTCCGEDLLKWKIKKDLLDLRAIYDPTLCVTCEPISCCTPCPATTVVIPTPITCQAPTNVTAEIIVTTSCTITVGTPSAEIVFNQESTRGFPPL